jgi:holo-[acyl-carrier protein] synthase
MDRNTVVAAICRMTRRPPGDVQGHLSLGTVGLSSSFGLTALRTVLESQGSGQLPSLSFTMTVDTLVDLVTGAAPVGNALAASTGALQAAVGTAETSSPHAAASSPAPRPVVRSSPRTGPFASAEIGLGMDMQEIASLPNADDYREHIFYAGNFTPQELATAVLRPNPRAHLCGLFCAKEAAKKSHRALLDVRMADLSILPDDMGRPVLHVADAVAAAAGLRFLVSITHTETVAAATCIALSE